MLAQILSLYYISGKGLTNDGQCPRNLGGAMAIDANTLVDGAL